MRASGGFFYCSIIALHMQPSRPTMIALRLHPRGKGVWPRKGGLERFFLLLFGNRKDVTPLEKKVQKTKTKKSKCTKEAKEEKDKRMHDDFLEKFPFLPFSISRNARKGFPFPIFFCSSVFRSAFFFFFFPPPSLFSLTGPA